MPWSQVTVKDQREEFVRLARQPGANISELCRRSGISRKTGYKWLSRVDLEDRSRRPRTSPTRTPEQLQAQVLAVRAECPAWGARKIAHVLGRDHGVHIAASTANWVLRRNGLIDPAASQAATAWQRFEHETPNALWQMDFKGHFATDAQRCHPLTVLDDHSRFNIVLQALGNERLESVQPVLQRAFERYGLPERINADNGPPWGSPTRGALTELEVWLIRLGVRLSHSRPMHPQTNGKDERFHRTLKAELLASRHFKDLSDAQRYFSQWRHLYNSKRPHCALGMGTPASRYVASPRSMPSSLEPVEYGDGVIVRRVGYGGRIQFKGNTYRVGRGLIGQPVALRPHLDLDGSFDVFFCHQKVRMIELCQAD
ncbi:IS481 family transposase [Roseateles chitinivorans]|uniref:IS481 family transposase n=1 Tax=Roseateles chitinivorans TaxID=2917965 RepID=UPI003D676827